MYRYLDGPPTIEKTRARFSRWEGHWAQHGFGPLAVEEKATGLLVGRVGLHFHRLWAGDPELGWMLDPGVWGRGYATEAAAAVLRDAFADLGCDRVVSIIHPENERSLGVARRLGLASWGTVPWDERGIELEVYGIRRPKPPRLQSSP